MDTAITLAKIERISARLEQVTHRAVTSENESCQLAETNGPRAIENRVHQASADTKSLYGIFDNERYLCVAVAKPVPLPDTANSFRGVQLTRYERAAVAHINAAEILSLFVRKMRLVHEKSPVLCFLRATRVERT